MSCVSFGSTGDSGRRWLERLKLAAADDRPVASFSSPEHSEAKVRRVRLLAESANPLIRESAALSYLAPRDVLEDLANDSDRGVRCCVARNDRADTAILQQLAQDPDAAVRGWVASNPAIDEPTLRVLAADDDASVRAVAKWAARWDSPHSSGC